MVMDEFFVHIQHHTFVQMTGYLVEYLDKEVHGYQHHCLQIQINQQIFEKNNQPSGVVRHLRKISQKTSPNA